MESSLRIELQVIIDNVSQIQQNLSSHVSDILSRNRLNPIDFINEDRNLQNLQSSIDLWIKSMFYSYSPNKVVRKSVSYLKTKLMCLCDHMRIVILPGVNSNDKDFHKTYDHFLNDIRMYEQFIDVLVEDVLDPLFSSAQN